MSRSVRLAVLVTVLAVVVISAPLAGAHPTPSTSTAMQGAEARALGPGIAPAGADSPAGNLAGALPGPVGEHPHPASESPVRGWSGLNSTTACPVLCLPPDPSVAMGNAYVLEAAGSTVRVWTSTGTLVLNSSLGSAKLFNTGADTLTSPQVYYDPTTLRWFATVEDTSKGQVYYAASASSDPTSTWYVQHFNPVPGGDEPTQPQLAVSSLNVVVASDVYRGSAFQGNELYLANKTQLLANAAPATWASALGTTGPSTVPVQEIAASPITYLLSNGQGGADLNLTSLSGSPAGAITLSAPVEFTSPTRAPPPAVQAGSSELVATGTARVSSAVGYRSQIWAVADVSCVPSGDSVTRACVHFWELSTTPDSIVQSLNWSTGPGTYDYDPALSVDTAGNVAIVFETSSATTDPSVWATSQTAVDPRGTLEPGFELTGSSGPDNVTGACVGGVCPFGNYSGIALMPLTTGSYWLVGEFSPPASSSYRWETWVEEITIGETYPVRLTEADLPAGTTWSVTLDGTQVTSSDPTLEFNETNRSYSYSVASPLADGAGVQFVADPPAGVFTVDGAPVNETINFTEQFALSTSVTPSGAGTISPSSGWFNASASVSLDALASSGHAFAEWVGSGSGAYSGPADPAVVTVNSPLSERANFSTAVTYTVTVEEDGLPAGTTWNVTLNGVSNSSSSDTVDFEEPNGSYSYSAENPIAGNPGSRSLSLAPSGTFAIAGGGATETVSYGPQFELAVAASPSLAGTVGPVSGWYSAGARVNLTAVAAHGYQFDTWKGSGSGNYSGALDPVNLTINAALVESATFSVATSPPSSSTPASPPASSVPSWELWAALVSLAVLVGLLALVALGRRRRSPPAPAATPPAGLGAGAPGSAGSNVAPGNGNEPWREEP
jgi:hypothetical protein